MKSQRSHEFADRREQARLAAGADPEQAAAVLCFVPDEVTSADIHAYVDLQLNPSDRAQVEAHLARRRSDRARVVAFRALNVELHALFDQRPPPMSTALQELTRRTALRFGGSEHAASLGARLLRKLGAAFARLMRSPDCVRPQGL